MNPYLSTLWVETLKIRKSVIFRMTIFFFMLIACMMTLVVFVQMYPETSDKLGMIGNKASMMSMGPPSWENYFKLIIQGIAGVGLVGVGFVSSWVFGREFTERTAKDLLALPVSRTSIVLAKFVVVLGWSLLLCIVYFATALLLGSLLGLPGWTDEVVSTYITRYFVTSFLLLLLFTPITFLASLSRGYMLPLGIVILTLIMANFSGMVGLGPYFPWSIPGLYGVGIDTPGMEPNTISYVILVSTFVLGMFATLRWWNKADQR